MNSTVRSRRRTGTICPSCETAQDAQTFACSTCQANQTRALERRNEELEQAIRAVLTGAIIDDALFVRSLVHLAEVVNFSFVDLATVIPQSDAGRQCADFLRWAIAYRQRVY